jgi:AmmeMemoRadiSam system protein B
MECRQRVFILGPSHHAYLDGCAVPKTKEYETPLGNLALDTESKLQRHDFVSRVFSLLYLVCLR